jgi:hypothetical protein
VNEDIDGRSFLVRTRWRNEAEQWTADGPNILAADNLQRIRAILDDEGPILVERAVYKGGGGREWRLFEELDAFRRYLEQETFAGDRIAIWSANQVLTDATIRVFGKCPDDNGQVPRGGAY